MSAFSQWRLSVRILSILAMVFLAVAVAAFPASAGKGAVGSAAHASHLQHGDHDHDHQGGRSDAAMNAWVCDADAFCPSVAHSDVHDQGDAEAPNRLGHDSAVCCDMSSCHAFALIPVPDASYAEMNSVAHLRVAAFALPVGLTSRLERPPRAA